MRLNVVRSDGGAGCAKAQEFQDQQQQGNGHTGREYELGAEDVRVDEWPGSYAQTATAGFLM
jgi:hypothetical protein